MSRRLALAATALSAVAVTAIAGPAAAWPFGRREPAPAQTPAQTPAQPAAAAQQPTQAQAQAQVRKATPEQRAQAERLDPLARSVFWSREAQVDPRDAEAGVKLAASLRALGRYDEAAQAAGQVLILDPRNVEALIETARAHVAKGQGFYAVEPLTQAQSLAPRDWRVPSLLGVAYDQVSRFEDARAAWAQALQLSPDNPAVLTNMALHYAAQGDVARAETLLRTAAARPGATLQTRQNLALVLGLQGKTAEAEQILRRDLPPEQVEANLAWLRGRTGGATGRTWDAMRTGGR